MINQLINYTRRLWMPKKNNKTQWKGYSKYTYLEGVGKDAKPVKFLARNDEDAQLYIKKVGATSWMKPDTLDKVDDFITVDDAGVNVETGKFTG